MELDEIMTASYGAQLQPIEVLEFGQADFETVREQYVLKSKPVLIRGIAKAWPAYQKWTVPEFAQKYGNIKVHAVKGRTWTPFLLSEYLEYMQTTTDEEPYYLRDWTFSNEYPELLQDYTVPDYFENWIRRIPEELIRGDDEQTLRWAYIGAKNTGSAMHQDMWYTSAWNVVLSGKKEWLFFHPDQTENVYGGALDSFNVDPALHPKFKNAKGYRCIQEPGDLVFTPYLWWHQVRNLEAGISITENFINDSNIEMVLTKFSLMREEHLERQKNNEQADPDLDGGNLTQGYFEILKEYIPEIEVTMLKMREEKKRKKKEKKEKKELSLC
jgi:hypothetical protein